MTGTPSKDRAEAHMEASTRTSAKICRMEPCYPDQFEMRDIIADALAKAHADGFAEGMKRAAEIAAKTQSGPGHYTEDGHFIASVVVGARVVSEAILAEIGER